MFKLVSFHEHFDKIVDNLDYQETEDYEYYFIKKKRNEKIKCVGIYKKENGFQVQLSYFIGVDWVSSNCAIYVAPKLNNIQKFDTNEQSTGYQTNYLKMLFTALKHPDLRDYTDDLFEIKFDSPQIKITQQEDLLTPLLIIQFLLIVKEIVKKGLKKSYYKVEQNLYGKVKGKVLVERTIKQNLLKNKSLHTFCSYDEFGFNNFENRLIKKALIFIQRYMSAIKLPNSDEYISDILNYIMPAFQTVSEDARLNDVQQYKTNSLFKEYNNGIKLAKLILQRFGYNINATQSSSIKTPPFWIDMSKLFELYVMGLLKEKHTNIEFQFSANYGNPDYLIVDRVQILDAKYKTYYNENFTGMAQWKRDSIATDIRQLSGYSRDKKIYEKLTPGENQIIDCIIIYPDQFEGVDSLTNIDLKDKKYEYPAFINFYAIPVKLPMFKQPLLNTLIHSM